MIRAMIGSTMNPSVRNPPDNWGYFSRSPRAFCSENYNVSRSGGYHSNFHHVLRLEMWQLNCAKYYNIAPATKNQCATWMQLHQNLAPATKMLNCTKYCTCHEKSMCNLNATSSNFAPATESDSWTAPYIALPRKLSAQLDCTFTKYFACHETCAIFCLYYTFILYYSLTLPWKSKDYFLNGFSVKTIVLVGIYFLWSLTSRVCFSFALRLFDSTALLFCYLDQQKPLKT